MDVVTCAAASLTLQPVPAPNSSRTRRHGSRSVIASLPSLADHRLERPPHDARRWPVSANTQVAGETKPVGMHPRVVALLSLCAFGAALAYAGRGVYFAYADSWVAPTTLSADDDRV